METSETPPTLGTMAGHTGDPPRVRAYMLPMDQAERLREAGGPLAEADLSNMRSALLAVVEVDGQIVAYWPVWQATHAEPLWVAEAQRHNPAVIRAILAQVEQAMAILHDPLIFAIIGDADLLGSGHYAMRLGFTRVPGDLFVLQRTPEEGT
jgi:hypothetical protein